MTPERRQELRDWSAEKLMGWHLSEAWFWCGKGIVAYPPIMSYEDWTPDLPSAPASQLLSVIDAMKELGWTFKLVISAHGDVAQATFYKEFTGLSFPDIDINPLVAVLLAAHAAWLVGKGEIDG